MNNITLILHLNNGTFLETTMSPFEFENFKNLYFDKTVKSIVFQGSNRTLPIDKKDMVNYEIEEVVL